MGADADRDTELALPVCHSLEGVAGLFMYDGNRDAGKHAPGCVGDGAGDGRLLRECGGGRSKDHSAHRQNDENTPLASPVHASSSSRWCHDENVRSGN